MKTVFAALVDRLTKYRYNTVCIKLQNLLNLISTLRKTFK